jgi:Na+-translocating ferredoxin:NAD+ oxidoreductase RnfC subunit
MAIPQLPRVLADWQNFKERLVVVRKPLASKVVYLIINTQEKQPYVIEDDTLAREIAEKMIAEGVPVMSVEEVQQLLFPKPLPQR